MDYQDRFDTALFLVKEEAALNQERIIEEFARLGIDASTGSLSKAKSKIDRSTGFKTSNGTIGSETLRRFVRGLEMILAEKGIFYIEEEKIYRKPKGEVIEAIYKDKLDHQLRDHKEGLLACHYRAPIYQIQQAIKKSEKVRMIQTFLTSVEDYIDAFQICLNQGGQIQLLLLHPDLEVAMMRARGLKNTALSVRDEVAKSMRALLRLHQSRGRLEIRTYDELPGLDMIAYDKYIFEGKHWYQKIARSGSWLEWINDNRYCHPKDINEHWAELWERGRALSEALDHPVKPGDLQFKLYFNRGMEQEHFILHLYRKFGEAAFVGQRTGTIFKGYFEQTHRCLNIWMVSQQKMDQGFIAGSRKRRACISVYTSELGIGHQHLAVGVYTNLCFVEELCGNRILMERIYPEIPIHRKARYQKMIREYLRQSEWRVSDLKVHNFEGLEYELQRSNPFWEKNYNLLRDLLGDYDWYFSGQNRKGERFLACRPLSIKEGGRVELERLSTDDTIEATIVVTNAHNFKIINNTDYSGINCSTTYLHSIDKGLNLFKGYLCGINRENTTKWSKVYLVRRERGSGKAKDYQLEDPEVQHLCKRYLEFGDLLE
ncbi:MAG: hypothetical protein AAFP19_16305 [Bacteroidota bacterium]